MSTLGASFNSEAKREYWRQVRVNRSREYVDLEDLDVPEASFVFHRGIWLIECSQLPQDRRVKVRRTKDGMWMLFRLATKPIVDDLYSYTRIYL